MRAIVAVLIAGVFLAVVGAASAQEPSISISPASGPCGAVVQVTGTGFPPNAQLAVVAARIRDGDVILPPTVTTDPDGDFATSVQVPTSGCPWPRGFHILACVLPGCRPRADMPFTVTEQGILPETGMGRGAPALAVPVIAAGLGLLGGGLALVGLGLLARGRQESV